MSTPGGASVKYRDTEMFVLEAGIKIYEFNPSISIMPRLAQQERMYQRYKINFMNITFKPATSAMTPGSVVFGIAPGKANANVKKPDDILKLRPARVIPIWKSATINVSGLIDSQRFMLCAADDNDSVAFTLYVNGPTTPTGYFQVAYEVDFAYPVPF